MSLYSEEGFDVDATYTVTGVPRTLVHMAIDMGQGRDVYVQVGRGDRT